MTQEKPGKRKYDSSRRKVQARETQHQILDAARELFIMRGFAGTSIKAIAQRASVATETVYANFGNKRNILARVVDISVTGDDDPVPLLERPQIKAVETEIDPRQQIQMFASQMADVMSRVAPLFQVMRATSKTKPEIAALLQELLKGRLQGMEYFIHALEKQTSLQTDLDKQTLTESVWALTSAEVYNLMTLDRGWSKEKYAQWLSDMLLRLLLP